MCYDDSIKSNKKNMNIQFYAKKIKLTPELKELIIDKLEGLKKFKSKLNVLEVRVDLSRDQHHKKGDVFRVEINVGLPRKMLRVVEEGVDVVSALDIVVKKLERQARDAKERIVASKKHEK